MEFNKKIIAAIVIIVVVVIIGGIYAFTMSDKGESTTTPFDNSFMSGEFAGNVKLVNNSTEWASAYADEDNKIQYNMSTCKNASYIIDTYLVQGMSGPDEREFNGQQWDIYTLTGMMNAGNNTTNSTNQTVYIYICVVNKENQDFLTYAIFENSSSVEVDGSLYCEAYEDYVVPLLESSQLKPNSEVPELYELLGMDQATFQQYVDLMEKYKAGEVDINGNPIQ